MERPNSRTIGINDFIRWNQEGSLVLSPKFQRRRIWPTKARAFLIDTIVRGLPIPKVYMRQHLDMRTSKTVHEVVDGQQRLAAVIDFRAGQLRLPTDDGDHAGKTYPELPPQIQRSFLTYEFSVDLLIGAADADVLDIFARINSYSVPLNAQEKRNARFFGSFKTTVYKLGYEHLEFWRTHRILSDITITRMKEAELASELVVAMVAGMQDKKKSLDSFYKRWDDRFPYKKKCVGRFQDVIDLLEQHVGDVLSKTYFRRPPLFYSLFLAVYRMRYGSLGDDKVSRKAFGDRESTALRRAVSVLNDALAAPQPQPDYAPFVLACQRQTDNIGPRRIRLDAILKETASS